MPAKRTAVQEVDEKSYQAKLNDVDAEIATLTEKKKELSKLLLKEIDNAVVMPLAQLNAISTMGYEKAKKKFGKKWVE